MKKIIYIIVTTALCFIVLSSISAMEPQPDTIQLGKQLLCAAAKNDWKAVEALIDQKADLNQKEDNDGWTTLMYATQANHIETTQLLIDADANPNQQDNYGHTALIIAAINGYTELAKTLIAAGANLNQQEQYGYTALISAIAEARSPEMVQVLITAGADLNQQCKEGFTALMFAADSEHMDMSRMIVLAHIAQNKKWVYTILNCLKRVPGGQYTNLRLIFKPILRAMLKEAHQSLLDDINKIKRPSRKDELLKLYESPL